MTMTLELTPEEEARLEAEARAKGIDVQTLPHSLIATIPARQPTIGARLLAELEVAGVIGAWADRTDIGDSVEYARELRN